MRTLAHAGTCTEVCQRIYQLHPDTPRLWGRMTVHGMICHLSDGFRIAVGEKACAFRKQFLQYALMKPLVLWTALPLRKGLVAASEIAQEMDGTPPVDFEDDLHTLLHLIKIFHRHTGPVPGLHPAFGKLSAPAWKRWQFKHIDHHLRQFGC
jgi:hypothetical protein